MKKQLLFGSVFLITVIAFPQNNTKPKPIGILNMAEIMAVRSSLRETEQKNIVPTKSSVLENTHEEASLNNKLSSASNFIANFNYLSSSMNVFGVLNSYSKVLSYNRYTNNICFIQRKSPTYITNPVLPLLAQSGAIVAYIGKNYGTSWDSTLLYADAYNWARYPQGGIYNSPLSNNSYVVATGPVNVANPSLGWVGNWYASKLITATGTNSIGLDIQFFANSGGNYSSATSPAMTKHDFPRYSFSSTQDGIVRSSGGLYTDVNAVSIANQNFRGGMISKGSFNSGAFVWTTDSFIPSCVTRTDGSKELNPGSWMAWNDNGTAGYMVFIGASQSATLSNRGWQPIVYRTVNAGNTWVLVNGIDFNSSGWGQILNSLSPVNSNTNLTIPFFNVNEGIDVTVDKNGSLHIFTSVIGTSSTHQDSLASTWTYSVNGQSGYSWPFKNKKWPYLIDFIYNASFSPTWTYKIIDSVGTQSLPTGIITPPNFPWTNGPSLPSSDMRLQMSHNTFSEFILYSWAESDTTTTTNFKKWNEFPNIKTRAMRVQDASIAPEKYVVTSPTTGFNNKVKNNAYFFYMSPQTYGNCISSSSATFSIPFTVSNNSVTDVNAPIDNFYSNAQLQFTFPNIANGCLSNVQEHSKNELQTDVYPNPASEKINIKLNLEKVNDIKIELYNILGKLILNKTTNGQMGENIIEMETGNLNSGIYFVKIKIDHTETTKKLVFE